MSDLRLLLIRHGEVAANRELRYVGSQDDPLTERGREQALALASVVAALQPIAIYSSPLQRTRQTAREISAACGLDEVVEERLREQSFGRWEGRTKAEVTALSDDDALRLRQWESDPSLAPPGGEGFGDVQGRLRSLLEALVHGNGPSGAPDALPVVALVTHVGPIKALLAMALETEARVVRRIWLDPATITVVDWGSPSVVRLVNSHAHLGWERARWLRRR